MFIAAALKMALMASPTVLLSRFRSRIPHVKRATTAKADPSKASAAKTCPWITRAGRKVMRAAAAYRYCQLPRASHRSR